MACIIHHKSLEKYSEPKYVISNTKIGLWNAKEFRERMKGETYHKKQCNKIPSTIDKIKQKRHTELL